VTAENLAATATDRGLQLRWTLSAAARRALRGIAVERATAAEGPYAACSAALLEPATEMSFDDTGLESGGYWYRLVLIARDGSRALAGPVGVQAGTGTPRITALRQPFEPAGGGPVQIRYSVAGARTPVRLAIYDARGRVVWSSESRVHEPGEYTQTWDRCDRAGTRAPRGVYFVGFDAGGVKGSRKLIVLRG
jgi:hypothetical protein